MDRFIDSLDRRDRGEANPFFHAVIIVHNVVAIRAVMVVNAPKVPDEVILPEHTNSLSQPVQPCGDRKRAHVITALLIRTHTARQEGGQEGTTRTVRERGNCTLGLVT